MVVKEETKSKKKKITKEELKRLRKEYMGRIAYRTFESEMPGLPEEVKNLEATLKILIENHTFDCRTRDFRYIVAMYNRLQEHRIAMQARIDSAIRANDMQPLNLTEYFFNQFSVLENVVKKCLNVWTDYDPINVWAKNIIGVGPILASGLYANLEIQDKNGNPRTPGAFLKFCGFMPPEKWELVNGVYEFRGDVPGGKWKSGERRPWNADLKVVCRKLGESFKKNSKHPTSTGGEVYRVRKDEEIQKNESGAYVNVAAKKLKDHTFRKDTVAYQCYKKGFLPPAHLDARAMRKAASAFIWAWYEKMFFQTFGREAPLPYPIAILGHVHWKRADEWV